MTSSLVVAISNLKGNKNEGAFMNQTEMRPYNRNGYETNLLENLCRVVARIKEYEQNFDIISVSSHGVHLTTTAFDRMFGTTEGIKRTDATQYIQCSVVYQDVNFFALFKVPSGLMVTTGETKTISYINIGEVELKP